MEYNEKLSHLTPDQIDDIVRMYSDKTFKVADIIMIQRRKPRPFARTSEG